MIILASQSPRRKEILADILGEDIRFETIKPDYVEGQFEEKNVRKLCLLESRGKCKSVSDTHPEDLVIASDTMVCYKGELMGKPKDREDAMNMLRKLSGDVHEIVTAYSIMQGGKELKHRVVVAKLFIEKMADEEIELYLDSGSPFDKAGAYGIQDKEYITSTIVSGDLYTIMGLPKDQLDEDLWELDVFD